MSEQELTYKMKDKIKLGIKKSGNVLIICLVLISFSSCSDDKLKTELWFEQATKTEVLAHEQTHGGTLHKSELTKEAEVFMRDSTAKLPIKVRYYFTKEDSVKKVMYEWSKIVPNLTPEQLDSIMLEEINNIDAYNAVYDQVATYLVDQYGFPVAGDGHLKKERFEMLDMWKRKQVWQKDELVVTLNMVWVPKTGYRIFKVFCEASWEE